VLYFIIVTYDEIFFCISSRMNSLVHKAARYVSDIELVVLVVEKSVRYKSGLKENIVATPCKEEYKSNARLC